MLEVFITAESAKKMSEAMMKIVDIWKGRSEKKKAGLQSYIWDLEAAAEMLGRTAVALRQNRVPHYEGRVLAYLAERSQPLGAKNLDAQDQILWAGIKKTIERVQEDAVQIDRQVLQIRSGRGRRPDSHEIDRSLTQMEHLAATMRIAALELRRLLDT